MFDQIVLNRATGAQKRPQQKKNRCGLFNTQVQYHDLVQNEIEIKALYDDSNSTELGDTVTMAAPYMASDCLVKKLPIDDNLTYLEQMQGSMQGSKGNKETDYLFWM